MKPTTLLILGAAGYVAYLLFTDGKTKQAATGALKSVGSKLNIQWNNGVPASIPQDGSKYSTQVNYYTQNPNASIYGVLFPNL